MPSNDQNKAVVPYVDLGMLFAMPIVALIDADKYACESFLDFVRTFGFTGDDFAELRMVTFTYTKPGPLGEPVIYVVEVPLLSLIPLPALTIQEANVDFNVEILGAVANVPPAESLEAPSNTRRRLPRYKAPPSPSPFGLSARIAKSNGAGTGNSVSTLPDGTVPASTKVQMQVKMRVGPSDLPEGILQILNLMAQSTSDKRVLGAGILIQPSDGKNVFTRVGERIRITLKVLDDRRLAAAHVSITLSQDAEDLFRWPKKPIVTDTHGEAHTVIELARLPARYEGTVLKTIWASAIVRGEYVTSLDATGSFTFQIRTDTPVAQEER